MGHAWYLELKEDQTDGTANITICRAQDETGDKKTIFGLSEEDVTGYSLLGRATGVSMVHCFSLGAAHRERFWERVYGFQIVLDEMSFMLTQTCRSYGKKDVFITVLFYEKKS